MRLSHTSDTPSLSQTQDDESLKHLKGTSAFRVREKYSEGEHSEEEQGRLHANSSHPQKSDCYNSATSSLCTKPPEQVQALPLSWEKFTVTPLTVNRPQNKKQQFEQLFQRTPLILALGRQRRVELCVFLASLVYLVSLGQTKQHMNSGLKHKQTQESKNNSLILSPWTECFSLTRMTKDFSRHFFLIQMSYCNCLKDAFFIMLYHNIFSFLFLFFLLIQV